MATCIHVSDQPWTQGALVLGLNLFQNKPLQKGHTGVYVVMCILLCFIVWTGFDSLVQHSSSFILQCIIMYMLWSDSQPSLFQSGLAHFEAGRLALKQADPIHDRWKIMAGFETGHPVDPSCDTRVIVACFGVGLAAGQSVHWLWEIHRPRSWVGWCGFNHTTSPED